MALTSKIEITCDLCKHPSQICENLAAAKLKGWLELSHEDRHVDRSFYESHVCPSCRRQIENQIKLNPMPEKQA